MKKTAYLLVLAIFWGACKKDDVAPKQTITLKAPTNGLVSYYAFDGSALDSVGSNNGTSYYSRFINGVRNNANDVIELDGVSSYVDLGDPFDYNQRTISVWFNLLSSSTTLSILYDSDNANLVNGLTAISADKKGATPILHFNGASAIIDTPINEGHWYNATIVVDQLHVRAYLNGELVGEKDAPSYYHSGNGTANAVLGTLRTLNLQYFDGLADDVRIYNRALTADEVKTIYKAI